MKPVEIFTFVNFAARKKDRYPASQSGLFYIDKGSISFTLLNGKRHKLSAGEFTLYNSGAIFDVETTHDFRGVAIVFNLSIFQEFKQHYPVVNTPYDEHSFMALPRHDPDFEPIFQLLNQHAWADNGNDYTTRHLALALLGRIVQKHPSLYHVISRASSLTVTQKVIHFIEMHIDEEVTLDLTAQHVGMSPATLKRRLSTEGLSFSNLLKIKRINYAANQLRTTSYSITQIAYSSGFKNAAHFSTTFKSVQGYSPKEFRQTLAQN